MKFELKRLSKEALPAALRKAEHYRLLNEPRQAESICRDILEIEPRHRQALITLLLALTDQFGDETARKAEEALEVAEQIEDGYERQYYTGLICERRATAYLDGRLPGSSGWAYEWYRRAMDWYEKAERVRPQGNDDALLRWNACARQIMRHQLEAAEDTPTVTTLE